MSSRRSCEGRWRSPGRAGREGDRHAVLAGRQPERHPDRLARVTDPVQAAGLRLGSRPGVHAARVELAAQPDESDRASRPSGTARSAARPFPPASGRPRLVRHDEDLAVAVRQVEKRTLERPPARTLHRSSMAPAGFSEAATISRSPTESCPRRSDPAGIAQSTSGRPRSCSTMGSTMPTARPSGMRGILARSVGSAAATAASMASSRPGIDRIARRATAAPRSAAVVAPSARWIAASCGTRDGARLEQPAQIGRQVGDRRFEQHPGAGLVHVLEALTQLRIAVERQRQDRRAARGRRRTRCRAREPAPRPLEHRRLAQVAANHRQQRELARASDEGERVNRQESAG